MHAKLSVDKLVMMGPNLHHVIYNLVITIVFSPHIWPSVNSKISVEDMLNTKGLVPLTEYHQVG